MRTVQMITTIHEEGVIYEVIDGDVSTGDFGDAKRVWVESVSYGLDESITLLVEMKQKKVALLLAEGKTSSPEFLELVIKNLISVYDENNKLKSFHSLSDPNYLEIIKIGQKAIPFLLKEVGTSWVPVLALHAIIGEIPFNHNDAGKFNKINDAWIKWGRENNYTC